jgi:hypothetical protein
MKWIVDPRSKEPSVPLTLLLIVFVVLMGIIILNAWGKLSASTSSIENTFWGLLALYWGHHNLVIGGKQYNSEEDK